MGWVKKALYEMTNRGAHPYLRFKLKMPNLDEYDKDSLVRARNKAVSLTKPQLKRLKNVVHFIGIFRFAYFPINTKILPAFYDLGLFVGGIHLWNEAYKWILLKDRHKYEDLDLNLDLTLVLLTGVLAGSNDGLGAGLWYRMGITRKLLKRLIRLIEAEQNPNKKYDKIIAKHNTNTLRQIEPKFEELIIKQCKFSGFGKYLVDNPDFEFPKIDEDLLGWENGQHIAIPGTFGGFDYFLEEVGNNHNLVLYAEQSSRMDHDSNSSSVFEVSIDGSRLLESEERNVVWEKFRQLDRKRFEEHKRKMEERRKYEPSQRE